MEVQLRTEEKKMRPTHRIATWLLVGTLLLVGCATTAPSGNALWREGGGGVIPPEIARFNDLLSQLAERLKPGLVQVRVRRAQRETPSQESQPSPEERRRTSGSGFLVREDGLLVTNAHVVDGAERIEVKLADGRRFAGKLLGSDSRVDLALVKIEGVSGLPVLSLGDSNRLKVGEFVLALGHPFGLEQTVSFGIVSRKGAPLRAAAPGFDYIQTDAAVNPGNSGGPLVSMAGEVVGINTLAARNGSIGFAIPINLSRGSSPRSPRKGRSGGGGSASAMTGASPVRSRSALSARK